MTIFSEISKYDYLQYEYFFKKIVIFRRKNMTKKKPMPLDYPSYCPTATRLLPDFSPEPSQPWGVTNHSNTKLEGDLYFWSELFQMTFKGISYIKFSAKYF